MAPDPSATPSVAALAALSAVADHASDLLKVLGNTPRLRMLCRLAEGEASVGDLAAAAGLAQSSASQHLGKLRAAGIVGTRREAQSVYYRIADPAAKQVIAVLCDVYSSAA